MFLRMVGKYESRFNLTLSNIICDNPKMASATECTTVRENSPAFEQPKSERLFGKDTGIFNLSCANTVSFGNNKL